MGRLFWWDFVRCGQWAAVDDSDKLVFSPCIGVVVKAFPEGSKSPLDLVWVRIIIININKKVRFQHGVPVIAARRAC